jgi:hypothetical protein
MAAKRKAPVVRLVIDHEARKRRSIDAIFRELAEILDPLLDRDRVSSELTHAEGLTPDQIIVRGWLYQSHVESPQYRIGLERWLSATQGLR